MNFLGQHDSPLGELITLATPQESKVFVMTETFLCESYMTCTAGDMFRSHYREHMVFFLKFWLSP